MDDYKAMLQDVQSSLPASALEKSRFTIPKVMGHIQGNRTVLSNFAQIAGIFNRDAQHILKYILRELATPGEQKSNGSVIMGTKIPASRINEKIAQYAHEFVLCAECGKPDTKIEKESQFVFLKCQACGARHHIKSRI